MPMTLGHLGRTALPPDRLADAPDWAILTGVLLEKPLPGRNDASRVVAQQAHVGEAHPPGVSAKRLPEQLGLVVSYSDEYRFLSRNRVADEGKSPLEESTPTGVQERLMVEAAHDAVRAGVRVSG